MKHISALDVSKLALLLLNNVYEIERKLTLHGDSGNAKRNIEKIKDALLAEGLFYEDPIGQVFKETRTDLEATISGQSTESLIVAEVIKPIIRMGRHELSRVVQKGIVVVQTSTGEKKQ